MTCEALILGATGSFGGGVARECLRRDRPIRLLVRDASRAKAELDDSPLIEFIEGDAGDSAAVSQAAWDCPVIVHGVNLPYDEWIPHMERIMRCVIGAAEKTGALIVFPGNVYGLGRQMGHPLPEDTPNRPCSRKGRLRVRLEDMLREAAESGSVRVLIVRAGDFYGPNVRNGLVDRIFGAAAAGKPIRAIGDLSKPHQWAYMPDLVRAAVDLTDEALKSHNEFEIVHFKGHVPRSQQQFLQSVATEAGHEDLPIRGVSWGVLRLMSLFDAELRELFELRYLFDEAVILDDAKLCSKLPDFEDTEMDEAIRTTVISYRIEKERWADE